MNTSGSNLSRGLLVVVGIGFIGLAFALAVSTTNSSILRAKLRQTEAALEDAGPGGGAAGGRVAALEKLLRDQAEAYARLQDDLTAAEMQLSEFRTNAPAAQLASAASSTNAPPARRGGGRAWLDRLKEEDPERYEQIQKEREERRERVATFFDSQLDRLDERYQVAVTQEEVDLVSQIAETVARMDELRQQWAAVRELPREERHTQARELGMASMETYNTLVELRAQDRQLQLDQLAGQVGYQTEADSAAFVETIQGIFDETDTNPMRFMGGGRGFGRGPR